MLTLGRESGQYVVIGGDIVVQVVEVGNQLRLAIEAPEDLRIVRGENWEMEHAEPACIRRNRLKKQPPKAYGFSRVSPGPGETGKKYNR